MELLEKFNQLYESYFRDNLKVKASNKSFISPIHKEKKDILMNQIKNFFELSLYGNVIEVSNKYLELDPKNIEINMILGQAYLNSNKLDIAESIFWEIIKLRPSSIDARIYLSDVFIKKHKYNNSAEKLKEVKKINPQYKNIDIKISESLYMYAKILLKNRSFSLAIEYFKESISYDDNYKNNYGLALTYKKEGKINLSISKFIEIEDKFKNDLKSNFFNNFAELYEDLQQKEKAIELYEKAIKLEKDIHIIEYYRAKILINKGFYKKALKDLIVLADNNIKLVKPLWEIIKLNEILDQKENSFKYYERILKLEKDDFDATVEFAVLHYEKGDKELANSILNGIYITTGGNDTRVLKTLAKILLEKGKLEEAYRKISKASFNEHNDYEINLIYARYYQSEKYYKKAIEECEKALKITHNKEIINLLINLYIEDKNIEKAILICQEELNKNNEEYYLVLNDIYFSMNKFEKCVDTLNKYLKIEKNNQLTLYKLALAYFNLKDYDKAIKNLKTILDKDALPEKYFYLSKSYKEINRTEDAKINIKKYLELFPNNIEALLFSGKLYQETGDNLSAAEYYKKVIKLDQYNKEASNLWKKVTH